MMTDKKRIKKDSFDMSSMYKSINIMTVEPPIEIKNALRCVPFPYNLKISPYQKYLDYSEDDKKKFIECIGTFSCKLNDYMMSKEPYLSYNYYPEYDDSQLFNIVQDTTINERLRKKNIYNYALDIFTIELTKKGFNPNKQFLNENSVYIEIVLKYE
jgi:hypothetical protein